MNWLHRLLFPGCEEHQAILQSCFSTLQQQHHELLFAVSKYIEKRGEETTKKTGNSLATHLGGVTSSGPRFWPPEVRAAVLDDFNANATANQTDKR